MSSQREIAPLLRGGIYTLVQSATENKAKNSQTALVNGAGTDVMNNESLLKRAKRKVITRKMILSLIDVAKKLEDYEFIKPYWNTYHCQNKVTVSKDKLYSNYCKNRFCTICCAIRKADTINRYYPTLSNWQDVHFVTLTVKAVKVESLQKWIDGMFRAFKLIHNRQKKRHERGQGIKIIGIKSLECNFNPQTKTYNPHYHIIVPSKEIADLLVEEWLFQWKSPKKLFTSHKAQYVRPVENLERDLIEVIKYGSKIFTEPDLKKKSRKNTKQKATPQIYAHALHNIFKALKSKRIFERFGFDLPKQQKKENSTKLITDIQEFIFPKDATDWIDPNTGQNLTGYSQPFELQYLLNECINTEIY